MRQLAVIVAGLALGLALSACADSPAVDRSSERPGPYAVGTQRQQQARGARVIDVQLWYPSDAAPPDAPIPVELLEPADRRDSYRAQIAASGGCTRATAAVVIDAPVAPGRFPVIAYSHCHQCTRLANAEAAERLASHGFIVVAPDHTGDTLWDHLAGRDAPLDTTTLALRAADLATALDAVAALPIAAAADLDRIGAFGHSFGAVTAGLLAQSDPRIAALAALAAPVDNPLLPGVAIGALDQPLLFVVAVEDNSITELGNRFLRDNYRDAPGEAWKLELADAGHWSVSDLANAAPALQAGCGEGERQTDGAPFTYLAPATGRAITAAYVTALFRATLAGEAGARGYLGRGFPEAVVAVEHHE